MVAEAEVQDKLVIITEALLEPLEHQEVVEEDGAEDMHSLEHLVKVVELERHLEAAEAAEEIKFQVLVEQLVMVALVALVE